MGIKTIQVASCDHCEQEIDLEEEYVDASVYGVALHTTCFEVITTARLLRLLGIDDIVIKKGNVQVRKAQESYQPPTIKVDQHGRS